MVYFNCEIGDGGFIQPFLFTSSHKGVGGLNFRMGISVDYPFSCDQGQVSRG